MEGSCSSFTHKNGGFLGDNSTNGDIRCKHGLKATLDVCKRGQNIGKVFLGCPLWKVTKIRVMFMQCVFFSHLQFSSLLTARNIGFETSSCGFFKWVNEMSNGGSSSIRSGGEDVAMVVQAESVEESKWESKYSRLKNKKKLLMTENEALKNEVRKLTVERDVSVERERVLLRLLYASWVVVVVALIGIAWNNYL